MVSNGVAERAHSLECEQNKKRIKKEPLNQSTP